MGGRTHVPSRGGPGGREPTGLSSGIAAKSSCCLDGDVTVQAAEEP